MGEIIILQNFKSGAGGALFDPVPTSRNFIGRAIEGGNLEAAPLGESDGSVATTNLASEGMKVNEGIDLGLELEGTGGEGSGDDVAFHVGGRGPSRPRQVGQKTEGEATIERAPAEEGVGAAVDTVGIDGDGEGQVLGGEIFKSYLIGKESRNNIFGFLAEGVLAEAEVKIPAKVLDDEVVGGVAQIGGGNGEFGRELDLGEVAEDEIFLLRGKADGQGQDGLAINGDGKLTLGELKVIDLVGSGSGGGGGFSLLDTIDKGKEIVPEVDGGLGNDEGLEAVADEFVPSKDEVNFGKGEDGGKRVRRGVEDEFFDGGALPSGGGIFSGGAEVNIGKEEGGGLAEAEGGGGNAGAEVVELEDGIGDKKGIQMKRKVQAAGGGSFETTEPAFGAEESDLGEVAEKKIGGETEGEGFDAKGREVLKAVDFEEAEATPTGGGKGGGLLSEKKKKVKGDRGQGKRKKGESSEGKEKVTSQHRNKLKRREGWDERF